MLYLTTIQRAGRYHLYANVHKNLRSFLCVVELQTNKPTNNIWRLHIFILKYHYHITTFHCWTKAPPFFRPFPILLMEFPIVPPSLFKSASASMAIPWIPSGKDSSHWPGSVRQTCRAQFHFSLAVLTPTSIIPGKCMSNIIQNQSQKVKVIFIPFRLYFTSTYEYL